jgi:hypothetical protein
MARFCGVEGGSAGELRCRVWWNGRIDSWHKHRYQAEARFESIKRKPEVQE